MGPITAAKEARNSADPKVHLQARRDGESSIFRVGIIRSEGSRLERNIKNWT